MAAFIAFFVGLFYLVMALLTIAIVWDLLRVLNGLIVKGW